MNISGVKGGECVRYYENFRPELQPELQPEIQDGFSPRGHPRSAQCFQFPAGCLNICLDLTPISAQPPRKSGGWPENAGERAETAPPSKWEKGRGRRRGASAALTPDYVWSWKAAKKIKSSNFRAFRSPHSPRGAERGWELLGARPGPMFLPLM